MAKGKTVALIPIHLLEALPSWKAAEEASAALTEAIAKSTESKRKLVAEFRKTYGTQKLDDGSRVVDSIAAGHIELIREGTFVRVVELD